MNAIKKTALYWFIALQTSGVPWVPTCHIMKMLWSRLVNVSKALLHCIHLSSPVFVQHKYCRTCFSCRYYAESFPIIVELNHVSKNQNDHSWLAPDVYWTISKHVVSGVIAARAIHYSDVIMYVIAFQITGVSSVCSTVCSGTDQRNHQSSASLAFVRGIHRWSVDSPHKGPVTRTCSHLMTSSWTSWSTYMYFML